MGKAIIRIQKLKSAAAVHRSMKHGFRDQVTPNADPERTPENTHLGANSTSEALERFNERLPDKVRKNAVYAVEYLISGSPDAMHSKDRAAQDRYFGDALAWLQAKHGAENVVYAGIHRDEKTPHMYAYVVPIDERGKLNCRAFFGELSKLSEMQTDFADKVGIKHGLERGLKGSKARHTTIREHYRRLNAATPQTPAIEVPKSTGMMEGKETYGARVATATLAQLKPEFDALAAKAAQFELVADKIKMFELTAANAQRRADDLAKDLRILQGKTKLLYDAVVRGGEPLTKLQTEFKKAEQAKQAGQDKQR